MSVDEAMIPFKGRLGFKQYMKDKIVLSDATNGYVYRLQVYTRKNSQLSSSELGLSSKVVLELVKGKENLHPKLYMDNYYTSHFF